MKKTFKKAFWNVIIDLALILSSIQLALFINIEKTAMKLMGVIIIIILALLFKYYFSEETNNNFYKS